MIPTLLNHFYSFQECTFQEQSSNTENNLNQGSSVVEAIFQVLYHCTFSPQTFGNVFVSYMEEEQLWDLLYNIPGMRKLLFVKEVFYRYSNISLKTFVKVY